MAIRRVTDTGLELAPALRGRELASPRRRLAAFGLDAALLLLPSLLSFYGVAALYFSWLTARRGATLGKRWLGLRVIRLDERPLGLLESFERFVGYAQVPGSLFTALADFWRDPNRRLPHDRLSGTLVLRA